MNMLKAGLKIDSITIRPSDILVYIYFQEVLQSKSHYSVDYHIPSPVTYLSDMEEYYKVNFYTHISKPLIELTGPKSISKYFIDSIEDEDFPGLLNIISGTLKKRLTEESPLTLEKLDNICKNLFRDIFGLTPEEEDRYIKELKDCLIEKIYTPACNTDYFRIEEDLLAKGILMKITDRICRFIVTTQSDYTEEFFRILIKYGFLRDSKQYAVSMSFYHMAAGGVPCICVCGSEAKEKTVDKENFHKALFDYLKYMEKERDHKIDRDFIKIID